MVAALSLTACDRCEPTPAPAAPAAPAQPEAPPQRPSPPTTADERALLDSLEAPPTIDELAAPLTATRPLEDVEVPAEGCVPLSDAPMRVWPQAAVPWLATAGEAFVVALYGLSEDGREQVLLLRVAPGQPPRPLPSLRVARRLALDRIGPPAVAINPDGLMLVAFVDGRGEIKAAELGADAGSIRFGPVELASGTDPRFSPAVAFVGDRRAVAWTDSSGRSTRVRLALLDARGSVEETYDLTLSHMSGAAPVFRPGPAPTELYFMDPRAGISPVLRVALDAEGAPSPARVLQSVGTASTPPEIAVASGGQTRFVGYTVVGNLATTAVGLLRLDTRSPTPTALVPGRGYGVLNVAAASGPSAAVFAVGSPLDVPPGSPREVHLRTARAEGEGLRVGPPLAIAGPDGTARHAAIARRADGTIGVAFESGGAVHVGWYRCDD